jgi:hypothetical protein
MDSRFPRQLPVALGALPGRKPRQFGQGWSPLERPS